MSGKTSDPVHLARSAVANAVRTRQDPTPARQQLKEAKLTRWIDEALATAPPLTDEQRHRLAAMLTGGAR
ncbi:hypothetical protein BH708_06345 [Brachybacterium sp. P6-10-X1]|uniref:hypothetical protein n=1 Tax=Brachybacterium sp. P6-10-X1 TaxID=1903186 RepID=UPI00097173DA|nr:hypothetical protein [Brachybacterium sp. P6-10-X1]APX32403.1 hypothetical protein BH708_06345 [Brachybacterium sp. P6-10-X1]